MSHQTQIPTDLLTALNIPSIAPVGDVGVDLKELPDTARPTTYLITAVVTAAPSDLTIWGLQALGASGDVASDAWGMFNDKRGRVLSGKLGTALVVGTHHFIVEDLGVFHKLYFQKSAGAIDVTVQAIRFGR